MRTRICDLFSIQYPIISGGMMWLTTPEFAAAVSNAGGLGIITAARNTSKADLVDEIRRMRDLTDKPFGVNVSMLPEVQPMEMTKQFFEAIAEEHVPVIETAGRDPGDLFNIVKDAGTKIIHKVPTVRHAVHAQKGGADAVTIVGMECGGHPGMENVGSIVLVPRAAESVSIPVIAGGGFSDARGLVAALALGAEGVCMGTRFMATEECAIHANYKDWMVNASERDTMLIQRSIKNQARVRVNRDAEKVLELEEQGATLADLMPYISGSHGRDGAFTGDLDMGTLCMGQGVGLVKDIKPVAQVISEIMTEAEDVMSRLKGIFGR